TDSKPFEEPGIDFTNDCGQVFSNHLPCPAKSHQLGSLNITFDQRKVCDIRQKFVKTNNLTRDFRRSCPPYLFLLPFPIIAASADVSLAGSESAGSLDRNLELNCARLVAAPFFNQFNVAEA